MGGIVSIMRLSCTICKFGFMMRRNNRSYSMPASLWFGCEIVKKAPSGFSFSFSFQVPLGVACFSTFPVPEFLILLGLSAIPVPLCILL